MPTTDLSDLWFFLDRGLGSVVVPGALRARGWQLTTMADLFLAAERAIIRMACRTTGPYVVSVSRDGLRRLRLAYPPG